MVDSYFVHLSFSYLKGRAVRCVRRRGNVWKHPCPFAPCLFTRVEEQERKEKREKRVSFAFIWEIASVYHILSWCELTFTPLMPTYIAWGPGFKSLLPSFQPQTEMDEVIWCGTDRENKDHTTPRPSSKEFLKAGSSKRLMDFLSWGISLQRLEIPLGFSRRARLWLY